MVLLFPNALITTPFPSFLQSQQTIKDKSPNYLTKPKRKHKKKIQHSVVPWANRWSLLGGASEQCNVAYIFVRQQARRTHARMCTHTRRGRMGVRQSGTMNRKSGKAGESGPDISIGIRSLRWLIEPARVARKAAQRSFGTPSPDRVQSWSSCAANFFRTFRFDWFRRTFDLLGKVEKSSDFWTLLFDFYTYFFFFLLILENK